MLDTEKRDRLVPELAAAEGVRISVYLPTHRAFPDNNQDKIVYKNLLQELETALERRYPRREWQQAASRLAELLETPELWIHATEGLGVLAAEDRAESFRLETQPAPAFYFGEHFHLLPLYPLRDSAGRAFLAHISRDRLSVYMVGPQGVAPMSLPDVKDRFPALYDDFDPEHSFNTGSAAGEAGGYHTYGSKSKGEDLDREKYFRYLDGAFRQLHRDTGLPILLSGTEDTLGGFRKIAQGPAYLDGSIDQPPDSLAPDELLRRATALLKPGLKRQTDALRADIRGRQRDNKAVNSLDDILQAAAEGRVETLLLPGTLPENERVRMDRAVKEVLAAGGTVYADADGRLDLPGGRMALLRY